MYTDHWRRLHELNRSDTILLTAPDTRPGPRECVEWFEETQGSIFERLLDEAVTPDERELLSLFDDLADELWRLETGKAVRGELRALFTSRGMSERRFYAAFHSIEKRMCCV